MRTLEINSKCFDTAKEEYTQVFDVIIEHVCDLGNWHARKVYNVTIKDVLEMFGTENLDRIECIER